MSTARDVVLELAEKEFADASANPLYLFQFGPDEGNKVVDETATSVSTDCDKCNADVRGSDFVDVAVFSTISFHANGTQPCADRWTIAGSLTV